MNTIGKKIFLKKMNGRGTIKAPNVQLMLCLLSQWVDIAILNKNQFWRIVTAHIYYCNLSSMNKCLRHSVPISVCVYINLISLQYI